MTDKEMIDDDCLSCIDHSPEFKKCKECGLEIDEYGNTDAEFIYCSFPNCGCDGSRLCMAKNGPNEYSAECNVEGMYQGKSPEHIRARMKFAGEEFKKIREDRSQPSPLDLKEGENK
jgi:hypothetical protein